jgi:hypothetical protein
MSVIRTASIAWLCFLLLAGCAVSPSDSAATKQMTLDQPAAAEHKIANDQPDQIQPREEQTAKEKQPLVGLFETQLSVKKKDDGALLQFFLLNKSGEKLTIEYGSGQRYDIYVFNDKNEEVYKWSLNKAFTLALIRKDFKANEKLEFEELWSLKDSQGKPVPPGTYRIKVQVMVGLAEGGSERLDPGELTAEATFRVE